jgi:hypothetical protein
VGGEPATIGRQFEGLEPTRALTPSSTLPGQFGVGVVDGGLQGVRPPEGGHFHGLRRQAVWFPVLSGSRYRALSPG